MEFNKGDKVRILVEKQNILKKIIRKLKVVEILMIKEMLFSTNVLVLHPNGKVTWVDYDFIIDRVA